MEVLCRHKEADFNSASFKKQQHMTLNVHLHVCVTVFFLFSVLCQMNNFLCLPCRTAAEAMVMNPPEPTKEKEKQGFFRAIKKKKKKTQIVRLLQQTGTFLFEMWSFPLVYKVLVYKVLSSIFRDIYLWWLSVIFQHYGRPPTSSDDVCHDGTVVSTVTFQW